MRRFDDCTPTELEVLEIVAKAKAEACPALAALAFQLAYERSFSSYNT